MRAMREGVGIGVAVIALHVVAAQSHDPAALEAPQDL